ESEQAEEVAKGDKAPSRPAAIRGAGSAMRKWGGGYYDIRTHTLMEIVDRILKLKFESAVRAPVPSTPGNPMPARPSARDDKGPGAAGERGRLAPLPGGAAARPRPGAESRPICTHYATTTYVKNTHGEPAFGSVYLLPGALGPLKNRPASCHSSPTSPNKE